MLFGQAQLYAQYSTRLSREHTVTEIETSNVIHPAMEHILETEGFEERTDEIGWVKEI